MDELEILKTLKHPNVIYLKEIIDQEDKDHIYLVTDWYTNGTIEDKIKTTKRHLPERESRAYFRDMLKALFYCHKVVKIVHRDIKPANIAIDHNK